MIFGKSLPAIARRTKARRPRPATCLRRGLEALEERSCPSALGMTLTPAGTALGLSLSVFVSGYAPTGGNTALGAGFPAGGGVLVSDTSNNVLRYPTDTDGQTPANATSTTGYGGGADAMATVNGVVYMTQSGLYQTVQLNGDGTLNRVVANVGQLGIAADPANGHLIVEASGGIYDVDPSLPYGSNTRLIASGPFDGVSVSLDGTIAYVANYLTSPSEISGFNIATGANVFNSGPIPGNVDGTAIGSGPLAGNILGNTNGGTVVEVNLSTLAQTVLASGGGRGDFATQDPNGTMLLSSGTGMVRLSSNVPPPAITSLSPSQLTESTSAEPLTVNGTGFTANAVVNFNGTALQTTYVSTTQLTATVPAADVAEEGSGSITVYNPGFGGGTSAPATLGIADPAVQIVTTPPQTVPTLFSSGVNAAGALLPAGATDPHFTFSVDGSGYSPAVVVANPTGFGWTGNTATSQWISYDTSPGVGGTNYVYHTTFDLTGFAPSTATITGFLSADDNVTAVLLNGVATGVSGASYNALSPFTITTGFHPGINTLDFDVFNFPGGPTGFQVQMQATADPVNPSATTAIAGYAGNDTGLVTLATFADPGGSEPIANYSATVNWGDGTGTDSTTPVIVDNGNGTFSVKAHHTYAQPSPTGSPYPISISISHESSTPTPASASATIVPPVVDVGVTKSAPSTAIAGNNFNYTITVHNFGTLNATGVTMTDTLPAGTTFVTQSQSGPNAFTLGNTGNTVNDTIALLPAGATQTFTITAHLSPSQPNGTSVGNQASVTTTSTDPNLANNTTPLVSTRASAVADLVLIVDSAPSTATPGGLLYYYFTVVNNGPSDAQRVLFNDNLPAGTTFVSQQQGGGPVFNLTYNTSANATGDTIATLPAGAASTFLIVARVKPSVAPGTVLKDSAAVYAFTYDPVLTNNSQFPKTTVVAGGGTPTVVLQPVTAVPNQDLVSPPGKGTRKPFSWS